ncbi:MAG: pyrroline-5-carboxylate reductase [candidate division FCPU426 bacterium]
MELTGKKIAFIGAGNMGEAMIRGLLKAGVSKPAELSACDLREEKLAALSAELGIRTFIDARQAARQAQIIVLAVKPQGFPELLKELSGQLNSDQLVISIAAGVTLAKIAAALPGSPLVRVMPNTPALVGHGASAFCLGTLANADHAKQATALLACLGLVLQVEEGQMDAVTALSGSGPAYVFLFMEALQAAGLKLGLNAEQSFSLAARTISGAAAMIEARQDDPATLRKKVTSPGGTTEAALKVFESGDLRGLVEKAMRAANDRSKELGR